MTNANFSYKALGVGGAVIISAWLTHKDKGALLVFDISANSIGAPGLKIISEALEGNATMTNLNLANNAATNPMDRSGRTDDISGVVALTNAIKDMGALTKIDLSRNNIPSDQEGRLQRICGAGGTELAI